MQAAVIVRDAISQLLSSHFTNAMVRVTDTEVSADIIKEPNNEA